MSIRILIADDDPAIRGLFRRLLEAQPGWIVCGEAVNGVEAIEQVARNIVSKEHKFERRKRATPFLRRVSSCRGSAAKYR